MGKIIDFDEHKRKAKDVKCEAKTKLRVKAEELRDWRRDHPDEFLAVTTIAIPGVLAIGKAAAKRSNFKKQEELKENYCYDPSLGHYWELKRKLSNREWAEIERRRNNGEPYWAILSSMRVLK